MFCKNCGSNQPDSAKFCSNCGSIIEAEPVTQEEETVNSQPINEPAEQDPVEELQIVWEEPREEPVSPPQKTEAPKSASVSDEAKKKPQSFWGSLGGFGRFLIIVMGISATLLTVALMKKDVLPSIVAACQLGGLGVAFLMHKGFIKCKLNWVKYVITVVALLLSILQVASSSWIDGISDFSLSGNAVTPYSAQDCVGKDKDTVEYDFWLADFDNIDLEAIEDLETTEQDKYGKVESVSINGVTDFEGNTEFKSSSKVVIRYHAFKKIAVPFSSDEIKGMDAESVQKAFEDAGFFKVSTDEKDDLDPDETDAEFENTISIDGIEDFEKGERFSPDADLEIITHRSYIKCNLKVIIDFTPNLIFSKYDVEFEIDDYTEILAHGEDAEFEYRLKQGKYTLTFTSVDSSSVNGSVTLDLKGDAEACYKISCTSSKVNVETQYVECKEAVGEDQAMIPSSASTCKYKDYKDVEKAFKNAGFTNIKTKILYDIFWGFTSEGEVDSVTVNGNSSFIRGDVYAKDAEIVITYHMKEEDDPSKKQNSSSRSNGTTSSKAPTSSKATVSSQEAIPMPVMPGSSLNSVVNVATSYGLTLAYSDLDFGHGTKERALTKSGMDLDILYSTSTKEVLCIQIVTYNLITTQEQKNFIQAIAKVACPSGDSAAVSAWVNNNVGGNTKTKINGFTYEVTTGAVGNLCYFAGNTEWEEWDSKVN